MLQFVQHEEGRIIPPSQSGSGTWEYQYHLKDHLGNTRVSFTTKPSTTTSSATMEPSASSTESQLFMNYDEVKTVDSELFDHTHRGQGKSGRAVMLRGVEGERTGLAQSLKVSKGDTIKAAVFVKYLDNEKANWTAALQGLMTAIAHGGNAGGNGHGVDANPGGGAASTFDPSGGFADLGAGEKGHGIYLNAIFFDKDMNYKKAVYKKMSDTPKENGENVEHEKLDIAVPVEEEGYMYVYYSNESATMTEAYYDDFSVTLVQGEIIQADDYYPFGLTFNSYKRAGAKVNKLNTFQDQELITDLDLNWVQFKWRNHDPAIGRFFNVDPLADKYAYNSPYAFQENKLGLGIELEGLELHQQRGIQNELNYVMDSYAQSSNHTYQGIGKVANGTGNIVFGTVGAVASGAYVLGTEGVGAALGGSVAFSLSLGEIAIGAAQLTEGISHLSGGPIDESGKLQSNGSLIGLASDVAGSENAPLIDAVGQMVPALASGGIGVIDAAKQLKNSQNTQNVINMIDSSNDLIGVVKETVNTVSGGSSNGGTTNNNNRGNSSNIQFTNETVSDEKIESIKKFVGGN